MTLEPPNSPEDELDAAAALELVTAQQRDLERRMVEGLPLILGAWAIAWLVGFTMLWLIDGLSPAFRMPLPLAVVAFVVLMAGALIVSVVVGVRMGRGIRAGAASAWTGAVYGLTWPLGFAAIVVLGNALIINGMPPELSSIYYPTASTTFVGVMYVIAGGIWQQKPSVALGVVMVAVACIAPFFGYPAHYLFFAIVGGGVLVLATIYSAVWIRRGRRGAASWNPR